MTDSAGSSSNAALFARLLDPVLGEIRRQAAVTEHLFDREAWQVLLATVWANIVTDPAGAGLREEQLEPLHDWLNARVAAELGSGTTLHDVFRFVISPDGEATQARLKLGRAHRNLLTYLASIILDPEGHRARMTEQDVLR